MSNFENIMNQVCLCRKSDTLLLTDLDDKVKMLDTPKTGTSIGTTVLLMIATGVPAGCVTVPFIVKSVGLQNFIVISAFLGLYTLMVCHSQTLAIYQTQNFNISQTVRAKLGGAYRYFFDFSMWMYMNGQLVVNYKLAARYVFTFFEHFGQDAIPEDGYMVIIGVCTQVTLLPRSLSDLSIGSQVGALALLYLVGQLVINFLWVPTGSGKMNTYTLEQATQAGAFGNMIQQYFFMNNLDAGYKELERRSFSRALQTFYLVTGIFFVYFTAIGVFGQLTYLDDVHPTIVNNSDVLSVGGRIAMFLFVNISTMVGQQGTKVMAMEQAKEMGFIQGEWSQVFNQVYSLVMLILFLAVAQVTPNIVGFIDIIAGLLGCVVFSVTPPIIALLERKNSLLQKIVFVLMSILITQFGVLSSYNALISFIGF